MKKLFFLTALLAVAVSARAVDYTFEYKHAVYDLVDYLNEGDEALIKGIEKEAVVNGVFTLPLTIKCDWEDSKPLTVVEARFWQIPDNLKEFRVEAGNPYFTVVDGVLYSKDMTRLVAVPHAKSLTFKIPATVKVIGNGAFVGSPLKEIVIPEGVTTIAPYAFANCPNLRRVVCPSSVTHVDGTAFEETPFEENLPAGMNYLGKVAFRYVGTMPAGTTLTIREGTAEIASNAVTRQDGLEVLELPLSVRRIGACAFEECRNIKRVGTIASDCVIEYEAFPLERTDCQYVFDGDRSRYHNPGDKVVFSVGFSMVRNLDALPRFSAMAETNRSLPAGVEKYNEDLANITFYEAGRSLSDVSDPQSGYPQTFAAYFGNELNKVYNLNTKYYKRARKAASTIYGVYYVRFHIGKDGSVDNVTVTMPCDYKTDSDAVKRLIEALPPFIPAMRGGKPVDAWVNLYVIAEPIAGGFLYNFPV